MTTNTFRRPGAAEGSKRRRDSNALICAALSAGPPFGTMRASNRGRGPGRTKVGSLNPGEFKSTTRDQRRDATDQLANTALRREKTGRERSRREGHPTSCYTVYRRNRGSQF